MQSNKGKRATSVIHDDPAPADEGTRERIVTTAMQLYAKGGLEEVSMRAIGRELGVSQMMAYRHFKSKDQIFAEIRGRVFDNFAAYLDAAIAPAADPFARLVRYCHAYVEFGKQAPADYRFIFDLWPRSQYEIVVRQEGSGVLERTRAFGIQLEVASDMLGESVGSAHVMTVAHVVWQSLHGLVALHAAKKLGFGMSIDELLKPTIDAIVKGSFGHLTEGKRFRRPQLPAVRGLISTPV
jgi:AcrR family transcriptional regulator